MGVVTSASNEINVFESTVSLLDEIDYRKFIDHAIEI